MPNQKSPRSSAQSHQKEAFTNNQKMRAKTLTKGKEVIFTRIARKNHRCHECGALIAKGTAYIEDHINYVRRRVDGGGYKKWYVNRICLLCWRGKVP